MVWIVVYFILSFIFFSILFGIRNGNKKDVSINMFRILFQSLVFPLYILFGICVVFGNILRKENDKRRNNYDKL
jgi:preprotein translocase subunit SecG